MVLPHAQNWPTGHPLLNLAHIVTQCPSTLSYTLEHIDHGSALVTLTLTEQDTETGVTTWLKAGTCMETVTSTTTWTSDSANIVGVQSQSSLRSCLGFPTAQSLSLLGEGSLVILCPPCMAVPGAPRRPTNPHRAEAPHSAQCQGRTGKG